VVSVIEGGRLGQSDHEMIEILVRAENARPEVKEVKNWKKSRLGQNEEGGEQSELAKRIQR
jgi:hypothetical protein